MIVVGTTPDYVARLCRTYTEPILFILDPRFNNHSFLANVDPSILLFTPLEEYEEILGSINTYLSMNKIYPQGVACFDCEHLLTASKLAQSLGLPFPSPEAIIRTRNKFESRRLWRKAAINSPDAILASSLGETLEFFDKLKKPVVLKPISGSGSELLFRCEKKENIMESVKIMKEQLPKRRINPLFKPLPSTLGEPPVDPCNSWIVEEFISGPEFSCDFILNDGDIAIIRETGKIKADDQSFGSILAYTAPPSYPEGFSIENLAQTLEKAAKALGFTWGYFMIDFIIQNGNVVIIEMASRPGGDSIPDLIEKANGCDILTTYLNLMSGRCPAKQESKIPSDVFASINIYARQEGVIIDLDPSQILSLSWIKGLFLKKGVGDQVHLPPNDYDNRILGYCVICPDPQWDPISTYYYLQGRLKISLK